MIGKRIYISRIQRRMFFLSFLTAFVAAFTQTLAVLVDNIIVCTFYGDTEIAAVSLAGPFFFLLEIPAAGLAAGLQTVCARELGAGEVDQANRLFNQIFTVTIAVMIPLAVLAFIFVPQMAAMFGARGKTAVLQPYAVQYLYGLVFEIVPYVLFCIMTPVVILDNGERLVSIASVCGCAADIILDLLSVRFGWGLLGIGIATSASAAVYFLITLLHFVKRDKVIRLRRVRIRFEEIKDVFTYAAPKAIHSLSAALRSVLLISLVSAAGGVVGTCVLAIHDTITYAVMIIAEAIAGAVGIMTGIYWGEKNGEELEGNSILAYRYTLFLSVCTVTGLSVFARPLAAALTDSHASEELLVFAIYCICFTVPFMLLVHARISYLQAIERIRGALWVGICADLVILAAAACIGGAFFGVRGVFAAFPVSQVLILCCIWLVQMKRTGKKFPLSKDYLEVDESFFKSPGDIIAYPIETDQDCSLAGWQVALFCRGHKLEERKSLLAGQAAEGLALNAVGQAAAYRRAMKTADIRVVIDRGDVIIRLRSSGPAFSLKRFSDLLEEDALNEGAVKKSLLHAADRVSYYRTYGMNTVIIKV